MYNYSMSTFLTSWNDLKQIHLEKVSQYLFTLQEQTYVLKKQLRNTKLQEITIFLI